MSLRVGCVLVVLVIFSAGGCSTPIPGFARPVTEISPSEIPAGTYQGEITVTSWIRLNGEIVEQVEETESLTVSFNGDGIPLAIDTGEPERPGRSSSSDSGFYTSTLVTESVVTAESRVTVTYKTSTTYSDLGDIGTVTTRGSDTTVYTLRSDGAVEVNSTLRETSEVIEGVGVMSIGGGFAGVLTLPGP